MIVYAKWYTKMSTLYITIIDHNHWPQSPYDNQSLIRIDHNHWPQSQSLTTITDNNHNHWLQSQSLITITIIDHNPITDHNHRIDHNHDHPMITITDHKHNHWAYTHWPWNHKHWVCNHDTIVVVVVVVGVDGLEELSFEVVIFRSGYFLKWSPKIAGSL